MLIIPSSRRHLFGSRWSSIGGMGEITDFEFDEIAQYTTADKYTEETAGAVRAVTDYGSAGLREYMSPPTITSSNGLRAGIESAAGGSLTDLIIGALPSDIPPMIQEMMADWLDYAIDMVMDAAIDAIADAVGDIVSVVPMLGGMIKAIIGGILDTVAYQAYYDEETFEEKSRKLMNEGLNNLCPQWVKWSRPTVGTGGELGTTVADYWRPVAYRAFKGMQIPMSPMSLFIMLCGGETQGVGFTNRQQYDSFLSSAKSQLNDPGLGLPRHQQRQMWGIIKGIMSSVQSPAIHVLSRGDHGRSLFPLLQDMVWQTNKDVIPMPYGQARQPISGYWSWDFMTLLSNRLCGVGATGWLAPIGGHDYQTINLGPTHCGTYSEEGHGLAIEVCGNCASRVTPGLIESFRNMMKKWGQTNTDQYWVGSMTQGAWTTQPAVPMKPSLSRSVLTLRKSAALQAIEGTAEAYGLGRPKWRRVMDPVMAGAGALAGGYLAWSAVRKFGPGPKGGR